jgi:phage terminase large subunit
MEDNSLDINISRKVFNPVYIPYLDDETRTQIFFGGASSGKSVFIVGQRVVYDLLQGKRNYLIIRNVANTSRISTFKEVKKIIIAWNLSSEFKINKSEMVITCINGMQAIFAGLDDVEKLKSVTAEKGVITDILIEEATETASDDLRQLQKRLRGKSEVKKRLTLVFNPIMRSHWIHTEYFSGKFHDGDAFYKDEELLILKTTYKDNLKFLEKDDIAGLEDETNEYFYNVYTLGNWGVLGDVIFTNWQVRDLSGMIAHFDNIRNGLDFGYANDPAAYNRIHYDKKKKLLYIFKELHEFGLTNPQLAALVKPIVDRERLVCDSAEPKSIQELKDHNVNAVPAMKGKDSINFGIQWLQGNQIIIDRGCQETINEFQVYQWKKTKQGETINTPVDKYNHHIDDIRYAMENDMSIGKRAGVW